MDTIHNTPGNFPPPRCRLRVRFWRASIVTLPPPDWDVIDAYIAEHLPPWAA